MNSFKSKMIFTCLFSLVFSACGKKNADIINEDKVTEQNKSLVFVNDFRENEETDYIQQYSENKTLIINMENTQNLDKYNALMEKMGGLSFKGKLILIKKTKQGPKYVVFEDSPTKKVLNSYIHKMDTPKLEVNSTHEILEENISETSEISSATLSLVKKNISCPMKLFSNDDETKDYCEAKASLELNYKIDMSGSKATMKEDPKTGLMVKTDNAKYILITVSPEEEGGTGWHITKEIKQEFNRWSTFLTKRDFVGPYANKYKFWIKNNTNNREVQLVETYPQNTNPGSSISRTHGMTIGLSGGLNAGTATSHPYAVVNLGASVQVSDIRNVSYVTQEYTIENESYDNIASWIWDSKINEKTCDYITKKDLNACHYNELSWKKSWSANKNKFSAISYKSFTPTFQAIFKTNKKNVGKSIFEMGTNVETGVILGKKSSLGLLSYVTIKTDNFTTPDIIQMVSVDWSSPYFSSEQNIRLQNMSNSQSTKCIFARKDNIVTESTCNENRGQIWGYDNEEKQFKTRIKSEYCLEVDNNGYVGVNSCNMSNNQKWILNANGFIQLNSDKRKVIGNSLDQGYILVDINSKSAIKFEAYKAFL